jgi:hypothetical protein
MPGVLSHRGAQLAASRAPAGAPVAGPGDVERRAGVPVAILELDDHPDRVPPHRSAGSGSTPAVIMAEVHVGDDVVAAGEGGGVLPQRGWSTGPSRRAAAALLMTTSWLRDATGPLRAPGGPQESSSRARSRGGACSRRRCSIDRARSAMVGKRSSLVSS